MKADHLTRDLRQIPELFALLPVFLLPGTGTQPDGFGGGKAGSRPAAAPAVVDLLDRRQKPDADPYRDDAELDRMPHRWRDGHGRMVESPGEPRLGVLPTLASWSRAVSDGLWEAGVTHDELGVEACTRLCDEAPVRARRLQTEGPCGGIARQHRTAATVSGECAFLLEHVTWISRQRWRTELAADVTAIRRALRAAVREHDPIQLKCTIETCGWPVEAQAVDPETGEAGYYRCTGCGRTWSRAEVSRLYDRQQPMSLAECAEILGRPVKTLHHWRGKDWIRPVGRDHRGALFSLSDVQDVAFSTINGIKTRR